jgi:ribosomal protein L11 methyltransferase
VRSLTHPRDLRHPEERAKRASKRDGPARGSLSPDTTVARFCADVRTVERIASSLAERFDPAETVVGMFEGPESNWTVEISFRAVPDQKAIHALIARTAGKAAARALTFETLADRDWVRSSLSGLRPVEAGRFIVHGRHDRSRIGANRVGIEIEAALAFGTGHHGTTRGCLLTLDRILKTRRPRRVVDLGTGTGVLAIAAAKALPARVLASDIDPVAVRVARANARSNAVGRRVEVFRAAGVTARRFAVRAPFDLVFANILLGPLQRLARPLSMLLAPNARVILSGLLPSQTNAALAAYAAQGLRLERRLTLDGWATLVLRRG